MVTRPLTDDLLPQPVAMWPKKNIRIARICVDNRVAMIKAFHVLKPGEDWLGCPQYSEVS
jgi:hypothetical protein